VSRRLAVILAIAALAGCGGPAGGGATTETESAAQSTDAGTTAPDVLRFTAPIVGGGELDGSSLAGRPVAFWFWAPT
jgi:hypothetical protein